MKKRCGKIGRRTGQSAGVTGDRSSAQGLVPVALGESAGFIPKPPAVFSVTPSWGAKRARQSPRMDVHPARGRAGTAAGRWQQATGPRTDGERPRAAGRRGGERPPGDPRCTSASDAGVFASRGCVALPEVPRGPRGDD